MAFKIAGRFIALSPVREIASSGEGKQPFKKQEIYMDCTRFDGITGQQIGYENKVLLEFGGDKVLDKIKGLNLQKDDVVNVSFDLQGFQTKDNTTGKLKVFTAIRCFDIEIIRRAGERMKVAQKPSEQPQSAVPPYPPMQNGESPAYESNHQPTGASPFPPQENAAPAGASVNTDDALPF